MYIDSSFTKEHSGYLYRVLVDIEKWGKEKYRGFAPAAGFGQPILA
jgi:hypothetical protein